MKKDVATKSEVKEKREIKKKDVSKLKKKDMKRDGLGSIDLKKYLTKDNITFFILFVIDVVLVIYLARKNIVNYVVVLDEKVFVSKTRYLLLGRNYVNLIVIAFVYVYTCLVNKFFLHKKNTKKFMFWLFVGLFVLNVLLFILFTKRVY